MKYGNISTAVTLESFNNAPKPCLSLFYYSCNFRCGFCHNHPMLGKVSEDQLMTEDQLKNILKHAKKTWKEMIVVGGGEPTINPELPILLKYLKNTWEFEIKLDTNGSRPDVLKELIDNGLIDYVAMDIKGTPAQYKDITGFSDLEKIKESIKLVKTLPNYEFRTTVLPNFHKPKDFEEIGAMIKGAKNFYLQQFRPDLANGCLDETYCLLRKIPKSELEDYKKVIEKHVQNVFIR